MIKKPHNILSQKDVIALYKSPELSGTTPRSFQCHLIFHVALAVAMRPTELSLKGNTKFQYFKRGAWMVKMCGLSPALLVSTMGLENTPMAVFFK